MKKIQLITSLSFLRRFAVCFPSLHPTGKLRLVNLWIPDPLIVYPHTLHQFCPSATWSSRRVDTCCCWRIVLVTYFALGFVLLMNFHNFNCYDFCALYTLFFSPLSPDSPSLFARTSWWDITALWAGAGVGWWLGTKASSQVVVHKSADLSLICPSARSCANNLQLTRFWKGGLLACPLCYGYPLGCCPFSSAVWLWPFVLL